jgi:leader peptidase (prepilin peptidase)/N-methyltransferase
VQLSSIMILTASPFIGSFIGCLADRLPAGRAMMWSRSSCDHCAHPLGPRDLVPLFSWLLGGAKCRYCRGTISSYYPLIEIAALAVAISALAVLDGALLWVTLGLGCILLILAAMDFRHMLLADALTFGLMLAGLGVAAIWSQLPLRDHILGMLIGGAALYVVNLIYRSVRKRDGLGMGDVKLMAGAGAWLGWQGLPSVLLYATITALIVVVSGLFGRKLARDTAIPFGAFICFGIWITWLAGPIGLAG